VLDAFKEVEDNLAAVRLLAKENEEQNSAVNGARKSLQMETARYKAGTVSYLDVIVEQNILLSNQRSAVQVLGRQMVATATLIGALGGGWDNSELPWQNLMKGTSTAYVPVTTPAPANPPPAVDSQAAP